MCWKQSLRRQGRSKQICNPGKREWRLKKSCGKSWRRGCFLDMFLGKSRWDLLIYYLLSMCEKQDTRWHKGLGLGLDFIVPRLSQTAKSKNPVLKTILDFWHQLQGYTVPKTNFRFGNLLGVTELTGKLCYSQH